MRRIVIALTGLLVLGTAASACAQTLKGSRATMRRQNNVAHNQEYTFLETSRDVRRFVESGLLVPVQSTKALRLSDGVSFPYARPAVRTFAQRLAGQYSSSCGERMVVTSLVRPLSRQPWNSSELSVHPAGMALDIRVSNRRSCRKWLEKALLGLEAKGLIDATREHFPAHFHVAVFPEAYSRYVARIGDETPKLASAASEPKSTSSKAAAAKTPIKIADEARPTYASIVPLPHSSESQQTTHKVRAGESLWTIAHKHGVTVSAIKNANDLRGSRIQPGQVLTIPGGRAEAD